MEKTASGFPGLHPLYAEPHGINYEIVNFPNSSFVAKLINFNLHLEWIGLACSIYLMRQNVKVG